MANSKTAKGAKLRKTGFVRRAISLSILSVISIGLLGNAPAALAHGGEDHGDQKVVATAQNGMVTRSARVGDFEILLKHPSLVPDAATSARLFITKFATNEPGSVDDITTEIEAASGAVVRVALEKTDVAGTYRVELPALAEGDYTLRATITSNGKTETATLSGISVGHQESATVGGSSWSQTILMTLLFLIGAFLFGGLVYLAIRTVRARPAGEQAVAA